MEHFIQYIIKFLLGEQNSHLVNHIAYAKDSDAPVVIIPSHFFDDNIYMTQDSMPQIPLKEINGIPLLFGNEKIVEDGRQLITKADIIAGAFFLISRYEECIDQENRDGYGRMIGKKSLAYKAGFLMRPIVDEYGKLLREWLRKVGIPAEEPPVGYRHIYLTHDVDVIWQVNNFRTFIKSIILGKRNVFESLRMWYNYEKYDEFYTFPWLAKIDDSLRTVFGRDKCTDIYFVKAGGDSECDNFYYKDSIRMKKFIRFLKESGAVLGIHLSFSAGKTPEITNLEKKNLEKILENEVKWNRNHYLYSRNPEDMEFLISSGITDDFTMGYADIVGFRLGTCRPVKWINPFSQKVTSLTLHPLTVMDCTLDDENYMDLSEEEARKVICKMLDVIRDFHGEVVLLWHNSTVTIAGNGYQRKLYEKTIEMLKTSKQ